MKYKIFPKGTKVKSVFKSHEEFEKWNEDFFAKIKDKIEENRIKRAKSNRCQCFNRTDKRGQRVARSLLHIESLD